MQEVARMQQNMPLFRRSLGWTAEEFGKRIGVTRQTINNLEKGRNPLTRTQYLAIRYVLDEEISMSSDAAAEVLELLLTVLIDRPEVCSAEEREMFLAKANLMLPAISSGTLSRKAVSEELLSAAAAIMAEVVASVRVSAAGKRKRGGNVL